MKIVFRFMHESEEICDRQINGLSAICVKHAECFLLA